MAVPILPAPMIEVLALLVTIFGPVLSLLVATPTTDALLRGRPYRA